MAPKSSIPLHLQDEVRDMAKKGLSGPKIAARLAAEHGCATTARAVQRLLQAKAERAERVAVPDTEGLTGRQVRFVEEYFLSLNATGAARKAGYSAKTAASQGAALLKNPKVKAALDKAIEQRAIRVAVKADDVLGELLRLSRTDIAGMFNDDGSLKNVRDIPEDLRRAISGFDVEALYEGRGEGRAQVGTLVKVRLWDKPRSLEMLMRHLGLLKDVPARSEENVEQVRARLLAKIAAAERDEP